MKIFIVLFGVGIFSANVFAQGRGDNGKKLSVQCAACHGISGISPNEQWPNLAGQKKEYMILQLHAFQKGERTNPLMSPVSKSLSEEDILDLAAFFSSLTEK
jgi:cytochrome c553